MRLPKVHMLHIKLVGMTLAILVMSIPASARRLAAQAESICVQAIAQEMNQINVSATRLNVRDGMITHTDLPILPPDNWPSPDGRYTAFWWLNGKTTVGLYIASTGSHVATLFYEMLVDDYVSYYSSFIQTLTKQWRWSPDHRQVSFAIMNGKQFAITIMTLDTGETRLLPLPVTLPANDILNINYGWSADQKYLAAIVGNQTSQRFYVWSTADYHLISSDIALLSRPDKTDQMAWSPTGHRLALYYDAPDTHSPQVGVWSPENGLEATVTGKAAQDAYTIDWSPAGTQIDFQDFYGVTSTYSIFGIRSSHLIADSTTAVKKTLLTWTSNGSAIMWYHKAPTAGSTLINDELRQINLSTGSDHVIAAGVMAASYSPQSQQLAYLIEAGNQQTITAYFANSDGQKPVPFWSGTFGADTPTQSFLMSLYAREAEFFFWSKDGRYMRVKVGDENSPTLLKTIIASTDGSLHKEFLLGNIAWYRGDWFTDTNDISDIHANIALINVVTGRSIPLPALTVNSYSVAGPGFAFSPDERTILASPNFESFVMIPLDGGDVSQWKTMPLNTEYHSVQDSSADVLPQGYLRWTDHIFAWSPDSSMLAYLEYTDKTTSDLVVITQQGKELQRLHLGTFQGPLTWVPCRLS